jgi:hypothetical protein
MVERGYILGGRVNVCLRPGYWDGNSANSLLGRRWFRASDRTYLSLHAGVNESEGQKASNVNHSYLTD